MITYLKGDLFNSPAQVLVNTVNTVGVMGKGVALEFKKRYPNMFRSYQRICEDKSFDIGKLFLWKGTDKWVLLFPTKKHWKNPSRLEYIELGLQKFVDNWQRLGIESIAFPRLGCGNGGLNWDEVRPIMEKYLKLLPLQVFIYVDNYTTVIPEHKQPDITERWLHNSIDAIGFNMLKEELQTKLRSNNSITFSDGKTAIVNWTDDKLKIENDRNIEISEDEFCSFWNYTRDSGVFAKESMPEQFSSYSEELIEILKKLEYLQDVIISKNGVEFESTSNGYQYIKKD
ncbi:macro domain-containing protein [Caproiciproducens sp.]|uniref:macro domain-containing protein n=1 Tax=Caproiciproducens sp. TaxID=1954376 RepID=UPI00289BBBC9|nr:macro domain-containing protein [Caproiciproducens sp.]